MRRLFIFLLAGGLAACTTDPLVCTDEFRMVTLQVKTAAGAPVLLDSSYTHRLSTGQRIQPDQSMGNGYYVVLDDSYHPQLKNAEDDFRFTGWKNGQVVVNEQYRIAGDNCHIDKKTGASAIVL